MDELDQDEVSALYRAVVLGVDHVAVSHVVEAQLVRRLIAREYLERRLGSVYASLVRQGDWLAFRPTPKALVLRAGLEVWYSLLIASALGD